MRPKTKRDRHNEFVFFSSSVLECITIPTEMSFIKMMTNSFLEILNLVLTKRQTGSHRQGGFAIYIVVPGHNKFSPFSFFFCPGFLRDFVQGICSLFDEFIMQVFTDYALKDSLTPMV